MSRNTALLMVALEQECLGRNHVDSIYSGHLDPIWDGRALLLFARRHTPPLRQQTML